MENIKQMNIFEKMSAITNEMATVAKNLDVGSGKFAYKAVSERDVLDTVKPIEAKYRVYSYPVERRISESQMLTNGDGKTTFFSRIVTVYRFVNMDNTSEYIDTVSISEGIDAQDKGSGKAMTYADKYALLKAYKISTGEDPDQEESKPTTYTKTTVQTPVEDIAETRKQVMRDLAITYSKKLEIDSKLLSARIVDSFGTDINAYDMAKVKLFLEGLVTEHNKAKKDAKN